MTKKTTRSAAAKVEATALILRVREELYAGFTRLLKPYGLTEPQFNVLRILRGVGPEGLPSLEVGRRMITRIPDVTRLLDRLEAEGLVTRARGASDRRLVIAQLSDKGRNLLAHLDRPVDEFLREFEAPLSADEVSLLSALMTRLLSPRP